MKTMLSSNATRWEAGFNILRIEETSPLPRDERERIRIYFGLLRFLCGGVRRDGLFPWEVG